MARVRRPDVSRPRLDPTRAAVAVVGEEAVLLELTGYSVMRANATGTLLLRLMSGRRTLDALAQAIARRFELPLSVARADVKRWRAALDAHGLLAARRRTAAPTRGRTGRAAPPPGGAPTPATVDVEVAGCRVRVECAVPGWDATRLARLFQGWSRAPRPGAAARLRIEVERPKTAAARALPRAVRRPLEAALARLAAPARARDRAPRVVGRLLATPRRAAVAAWLDRARAPVVWSFGATAFFGDLARRRALLLVPAGRVADGCEGEILNAHGVLLAAVALARGGLLLHSSAVVWRGRGYVFCGRSRGGKSTVGRLAGRAALSDDGSLVLPRGAGYFVAGTPMRQLAARRARSGAVGRGARLAALSLLRKAPRTRAEPIAPAAALAEVMGEHVHFLALAPPDGAAHALANAAALLRAVPAYRLHFTRDVPLARLLAGLAPEGRGG